MYSILETNVQNVPFKIQVHCARVQFSLEYSEFLKNVESKCFHEKVQFCGLFCRSQKFSPFEFYFANNIVSCGLETFHFKFSCVHCRSECVTLDNGHFHSKRVRYLNSFFDNARQSMSWDVV